MSFKEVSTPVENLKIQKHMSFLKGSEGVSKFCRGGP